jgi:hypothetical protein
MELDVFLGRYLPRGKAQELLEKSKEVCECTDDNAMDLLQVYHSLFAFVVNNFPVALQRFCDETNAQADNRCDKCQLNNW